MRTDPVHQDPQDQPGVNGQVMVGATVRQICKVVYIFNNFMFNSFMGVISSERY